MNEAANAGVKFVNVSPLRADTISALNAECFRSPSTDTALMLGLGMRSLRETYPRISNDVLLGLMNSRRISWGNQMEFETADCVGDLRCRR